MHPSRPTAALDLLKQLSPARSQMADSPQKAFATTTEPLKRQALGARARGDHARAANLLSQAVAAAPTEPELLFLQGVALYEQGLTELALPVMRQTLAMSPDNPSVLANLGRILVDLGEDAEAESVLERALTHAPDETAAIRALAVLKRDRGCTQRADDLWQRLLALRPGDGEANYNLVHAPHYRPSDMHVELMESYADIAHDPNERTMLAFALFRAHEKRGAIERAFAWLQRGNALMRARQPYHPEPERQAFAALKTHFHAGFFDGLPATAAGDPIFIVGMPRSGTSLAEQILASHPDVHGAGERPDMVRLVGRYLTSSGDGALSLEGFVPGSPKARAMAQDYLHTIAAQRGGAPHVTDKMPLNFRFIGIIKTLFPAARIIHCTRKPIETCMSIYASMFGSDGNRFANDLNDLGEYYGNYVELMRHWDAVLGEAHILRFDLDCLRADQEGETRRLLAFCGLDWNEACLSFEQTERSVKTLSATQVRQPLDRRPDKRSVTFRSHLKPLEDSLRKVGIDPQRFG
ncbi:tetratricopeptide repeat-containing sulfotransferase family protein [Rhizobium halophytocola]|uniref:Tetratricopeptide (TPR) repeat protein n=1 Tax=Rhizobium halophytocola TaxID=735519 RepID=A0ABS4DSC5_9HYPH|nr:sulfotransferase [Rhizobium halophytocola]MBP1848592.1 tetratricopeptide (TPR) repeat protein [Rhizobium halophytocola]